MEQLVTTATQVGQILRARRKAKKLSQKEIAAKVGVSQGRLSVLEGDPSSLPLERLIALANVLGLELVLRDPAPPAKKARAREW